MDNSMKRSEKQPRFSDLFNSIVLSSQRFKLFTILSCCTSFTLTNLQTNAQQNTDD